VKTGLTGYPLSLMSGDQMPFMTSVIAVIVVLVTNSVKNVKFILFLNVVDFWHYVTCTHLCNTVGENSGGVFSLIQMCWLQPERACGQ